MKFALTTISALALLGAAAQAAPTPGNGQSKEFAIERESIIVGKAPVYHQEQGKASILGVDTRLKSVDLKKAAIGAGVGAAFAGGIAYLANPELREKVNDQFRKGGKWAQAGFDKSRAFVYGNAAKALEMAEKELQDGKPKLERLKTDAAQTLAAQTQLQNQLEEMKKQTASEDKDVEDKRQKEIETMEKELEVKKKAAGEAASAVTKAQKKADKLQDTVNELKDKAQQYRKAASDDANNEQKEAQNL